MNVGSLSSAASMAQEAMETVAQSKAEAAKGDQQAVRKLARQQVEGNAQPAQQPVAANPARGLDLLG